MILAVETSAKTASVCLMHDGINHGLSFINRKLTHSETLMPMINDLLANTKLGFSDIEYFAVSTGPGSFTGLRIGVAAIKGLAYALDKPCVAVSTLETMKYNASYTDCIICAVMDARCNQVYNALFENDHRLTEDRAVKIDELQGELQRYDKKIILVGDGAELCFESMKNELKNVSLANENVRYQTAYGVAMKASEKIKNGEIIPAKDLMPFYLRPPQAERELSKRREVNNK